MRVRCGLVMTGVVMMAGSLMSGSLFDYPMAQSARAAEASPPIAAVATPSAPGTGGGGGAAQHFDEHIAPLLARHCLECHGPEKKKGRLDLSFKDTALLGGKSGQAIVPGNAADSPLWHSVEADEMPEDRPPLSAREKELLKQWIDAGAVWSADPLAPLKHLPDPKVAGNYLRRLTVPEYIETVRSLFGVDITFDAHRVLPRDVRADGFSNTAYNLTVDLGHVEAYAKLARLIVERIDVPAFVAAHAPCRELTDACLRQVVTGMGKQVLRGPLDEREITAFLSVARAVADAGGDFNEAVGFVMEAMLQSPRFVYRIEKQRGDGSPQPLGDHELASRLSYIVWGAPPDDELMRAADAGELSHVSVVEAQARRMLENPRAVERSTRFLEEWLNLGRLNNLNPNKKRYPKWDPELASDVQQETAAFFEHVVWKQKRPMYDLINAQLTVGTPRLAKFYGLKPQGSGEDQRVYDLSSVPARGGLFTQAAVLTIGGDDASMVARGLFVLHDVLWSKIDPPPPCVDTTPVPTKPGLTQRAIAIDRLNNKQCGGCHGKFEPLAFGLEKFDGIGAYHEKDEHGNKLRDDGEVLFPGEDKPVKYNSSAELMDLLAGSERVRMGITRKLTQFALGRPLVAADAPIVEKIHQSAQQGGGTYASLITAIVTSDLVRMTATEPAK